MRTKSAAFLVSVTLLLGGTLGRADTLVSYNFNDQTNQTATLTASFLGANLSSASLFSVSDGSFTSTNVTTASPPDTPAISDSNWIAATPTKYYSFTITPTASYEISITSLTFDYRQTTTGALSYQIDIGSNANAASGSFTADTTWRQTNATVTLTGLTGAIEVRIYGYGYTGSSTSGTFGIDRVTLNGTASAIPEPSTYALLDGLAALGLVVYRRKTRLRR